MTGGEVKFVTEEVHEKTNVGSPLRDARSAIPGRVGILPAGFGILPKRTFALRVRAEVAGRVQTESQD